METKTNDEKLMIRSKIPIWQLQPHPKNVRRDVGDVTELAASIKAQGIMQNLVIVPAPGHEDNLDLFWVVIGNRRLAAAEMAGLEKLPCTIATGLSDEEQLTIMLTENLQRRDLTPEEEAQAYEQLTLNFGMAVDEIAEKTGVSASTIRRRLKINELDPTTIKEKEFQLSIGDYSALEKVKDKSLRNQVLEKAESSENLKYLADRAAAAEERRENVKVLREIVAGLFDGELIDKRDNSVYLGVLEPGDDSGKVKACLDKWDAGHYDELYLQDNEFSAYIYVYGHRKAETEDGEEPVDREKLRQEKRDRDHKFVLKKCREMANDRQAFIAGVINGQYKLPEGTTAQDAQARLWRILRALGDITTRLTTLTAYWTHSDESMVFDADMEMLEEMPDWIQMLATAGKATDRSDYLCKYNGGYYQDRGETLQSLVRFLEAMGYSITDQDQRAILEGTHDSWENVI